MNHEDYMRIALEESKIALEEGNWPIGCVIELKGDVIAREHNRVYMSLFCNEKGSRALGPGMRQ